MKQDVSKLVGICGLYCGTCPSYLAGRKNDEEYLERMSRERGYSIEEIRCDGCLSDKVAVHCTNCRHGFRKCAAEKQVTWCFQCDDFPCQRLKDFTDVHIVNGISHHERVIDDLEYMKKHGIEAWVEAQEKAACCPACGEMLYWFERECSGCHTQVR